MSPGTPAYNVALSACARAGELDRASALLADMRSSGATPDESSFASMRAAASANIADVYCASKSAIDTSAAKNADSGVSCDGDSDSSSGITAVGYPALNTNNSSADLSSGGGGFGVSGASGGLGNSATKGRRYWGNVAGPSLASAGTATLECGHVNSSVFTSASTREGSIVNNRMGGGEGIAVFETAGFDAFDAFDATVVFASSDGHGAFDTVDGYSYGYGEGFSSGSPEAFRAGGWGTGKRVETTWDCD